MAMNPGHQDLCSSAEWAQGIRDTILPWALEGVDVGADVLEVGPGYGAATRVLAQRPGRLTALEVDEEAVARLRREFSPAVTIVAGDGVRMPFDDGAFSAAVCFTMLHHVPGADAQDRLFAEAVRVVRSGGHVLGTDSVESERLRHFHVGDTYNPLPVDTLGERLARAGLFDVQVELREGRIRFRGAKP